MAEANAEVALIPELNATEKKVKKIIRRKRRPARVQMDPALIKDMAPPQTGTTFNIWYNKWSGGDREDKYLAQTHAKGRCNIAEDAGFTRADRVSGSFFCLYVRGPVLLWVIAMAADVATRQFARGICPKGRDCEYLHRLPGIHDMFNPNVDCFGRDKFSDVRTSPADMEKIEDELTRSSTVTTWVAWGASCDVCAASLASSGYLFRC